MTIPSDVKAQKCKGLGAATLAVGSSQMALNRQKKTLSNLIKPTKM